MAAATNFPTQRDAARVITSETRYDVPLLETLDAQIQAIGGEVVEQRARPFMCCYPKADPDAPAIAVGKAVALRGAAGPSGEPLMVLATHAALAGGAVLLGVLAEVAQPGQRARVVTAGAVPSSISGLSTAGVVEVASDGSLAVVGASFVTGDWRIGRSTSGGLMVVEPQTETQPAGGGGSGTAAGMSYDPTASGMAATNVQAAIDELDAAVAAGGAPVAGQGIDVVGSTISVDGAFGAVNLSTTGTCSVGAATCTSLDAGSGTVQTTGTMYAGNLEVLSSIALGELYDGGHYGATQAAVVEVATTDATVTTLLSLASMPDNCTVTCVVEVTGTKLTTTGSYFRTVRFRGEKISGVLTQVSATADTANSTGASGWVAAFTTGGVLQVTGAAATSIRWTGEATISYTRKSV